MTTEELSRLFEAQGKKRWLVAKSTAKERIHKLQKLRNAIVGRQNEFYDAVWSDFHKSRTEAWLCEVFPTLEEIDYTIAHLNEWMKDKPGEWTFLFPTNRSYSHFEPKGRVLVMAPWNYPLLLFLNPIISAVAAGNVIIAKPSQKTPHVSQFLSSLLAEVFEKDEVAVVEGNGAELGDMLLALPFDHIFFTGSPKVGAHIAERAAKIHASVTLELGGKSPTVILNEVNLADTAKKIAWGKMLNAGQTCIAPDYILCPKNLVQPLSTAIVQSIKEMYGQTEEIRKTCEDFVHIIDNRAVIRHKELLEDALAKGANALIGGPEYCDTEKQYTPATILTGVAADMKIMDEEIFGPILPILAYDTLDQALAFIQSRPKPLALYIFGKSPNEIERVLANTTSGSTCINNCILQIENLSVPFGGVGMSGTGNYHGYYGFKAFSHERNTMEQGIINAVATFYPPYHKQNEKNLRAKIQRRLLSLLKILKAS